MTRTFISYRNTDDAQAARVRSFAERLQGCGVEVILDQFYLEQHPGGPDDGGWPRWCDEQVRRAEKILVIGEEEWFRGFELTAQPGTGRGAAREARLIDQRLYDGQGRNPGIRIACFGKVPDEQVPAMLRAYHRFDIDRDFDAIVRWLGGRVPAAPPLNLAALRTSIPNNLPSIQPFFGREGELEIIRGALEPESRIWGALIDGPGGMGKTSLAVRAAYAAPPEDFERIIFISLKTRELDDDGERDLSGFILTGLQELYNELARELGHPDIPKLPEDQRPRALLDALRGQRILLVLDNLESLTIQDRGTILTLVKRLPQGCKAILTSRGRIGSGAEELILGQLSQEAALEALAELARHNPELAKTSEAERITLYTQTSGKPLLLRWTAGQLGRGHCRTFTDAIAFLLSCPKGNDPLKFIFGDLVEDFSEEEMKVIAALTYFTLPVKVKHIAPLADLEEEPCLKALNSLVNRSLATPSKESQSFVLVPMVAAFLREHRREMVKETGDRLEKRAYALIVENGYQKHDRFSILDAAWDSVAPALPLFLAGPSERLDEVCTAVGDFLDFTGRWDEWLSLEEQAEVRAVAEGDHGSAGWRAHQAGYINFLRRQADGVLAGADRAAAHWEIAQADTRERACAIRLRGIGHQTKAEYSAAIEAYQEALKLFRSLSAENEDVVMVLGDLADVAGFSGDHDEAERNYQEALQVARAIGHAEGVVVFTGNLGLLAFDRKDWKGAEYFAREALLLAENLGRQELISSNCVCLARALACQGKPVEGLSYARQGVEIYTRLGSPNLKLALAALRLCEEASAE